MPTTLSRNQEVVTKIVKDHLDITSVELDDNLRDHGADDLDLVEILMIVEEEFMQDLPDKDYETIRNYTDELD